MIWLKEMKKLVMSRESSVTGLRLVHFRKQQHLSTTVRGPPQLGSSRGRLPMAMPHLATSHPLCDCLGRFTLCLAISVLCADIQRRCIQYLPTLRTLHTQVGTVSWNASKGLTRGKSLSLSLYIQHQNLQYIFFFYNIKVVKSALILDPRTI